MFVLLCFFSINTTAQTGKIIVTVKNSFTGIAENAKIVINNNNLIKNGETNGYGLCEFELLSDNYQLIVSSDGFISQTSHYFVEPSKTLNIIVSLDPVNIPLMKIIEGKAMISGYIVDEGNNLPVVKAKVVLSPQNKIINTDVNGYFELIVSDYTSKDLPIDKIQKTSIKISKEGYNEYNFVDIPLYDENSFFKITLNKGNEKETRRYEHKLIDTLNEIKLDESSFESNDFYGLPSKNVVEPINKINSNNTLALPSVIRLYHGVNNGPCISCTSCVTIEQLSLEEYVRGGLDDEWIPSWTSESLKAGAVAYRTYGAYHVFHPYGANYDIVAYPCRQHWDGTTRQTSTINATNATVNEVLVDCNNNIVFSEYASETNNFGCGDCYSGQGNWPCISDNVCCGKSPFGHGRGMCQWGSQRWAQQSKTYTWILDHYYNPGGYYRWKNGITSLPDLIITGGSQSVTPSTNIHAGSNITVFASETNKGVANTCQNVVGLWLSADGVLNTNEDLYLGKISGYPILIPNTSSNILTATVQIPSNTQPGNYYLFFWADGTLKACETIENNNFATKIINICAVPSQPGIINGNSSVCSGIRYIYNISPAAGASSYIWTLPFGWAGSSSSTSITCTPGLTSGTIKVKAINNCGSSTEQTKSVTVVSPTLPVLIRPANSATLVSIPVLFDWDDFIGLSAQYRIQVSTSNAGWTAINGFTSGTNQTSIIRVNLNTGSNSYYNWTLLAPYPPEVNKKYYWTVRTEVCNTKSNYTPVRSFTTSGSKSVEIIDIPDNNSEISAFPNPFYNEFTLMAKGELENSYVIFNALGLPVKNGSFIHKTKVTLSNFNSGIYLIRINTGTSIVCIKMFKE